MKYFLSLIFIVSIVILTKGQNPKNHEFSVIHFIRSGGFVGAACRTDISFPYQQQVNLSHNSILHYKVYSEGDIRATLDIFCSGANGGASSASRQVNVTIKHGSEHYILYHNGKFNQLEKHQAEKYISQTRHTMHYEENINSPIIQTPSTSNNKTKKEEDNKLKKQGTCFLIRDDGYLITNHHCIEDATNIYIRGINGDFSVKYNATVIATDHANDLALIKINSKNVNFNTPLFAIRSSGIEQAEKIYTLGFPNAMLLGEEIKITEGIVSAKSGLKKDISKMQVSAAVNPGNSGGPLIDENGNLIGIIYAKLNNTDAAGYAIKASYLEAFLKNIDAFYFEPVQNTISELPLTQKVQLLKQFVFIVETE